MEVHGRKRLSGRPFILKIHSELVATELFRMVSSEGHYQCYRLLETPFRLTVPRDVKGYSDLRWQVDCNSRKAKDILPDRLKLVSKPKPIKVKRSNSKSRIIRPKFITVDAVEFRQMFMDIFDELPDYIQEGFVCNVHLFYPDLENND